MKAIVFILCLAACGLCKAQEQAAISSKRNGQTQASSEATTSSPSQNPTTATLVSGDRQATVKEVPVEKEAANTATTPVPVSSAKKPD